MVFHTLTRIHTSQVIITERRGKIRKLMNALDNAREGRATDMLLNYETVSGRTHTGGGGGMIHSRMKHGSRRPPGGAGIQAWRIRMLGIVGNFM